MENIEQRTKHVLHEYDLRLHNLVQEGQNRWKAETDCGSFWLEVTHEHPLQLNFVASWLRYLSARGVRSVIPFCLTKYGEPCVVTYEGTYLLLPWIEQIAMIKDLPDWDIKVLKEMARIHKISAEAGEQWRGYAPVSLRQVRQRWEEGIARIEEIAEAGGKRKTASAFERAVRNSAEQVRQFAEWGIQELEKVAVSSDVLHLSRALCHGRVHSRNILVGAGRQIYFINFERANFDTPVRDVTLFFRRYGPAWEWRKGKGREWLYAYESERCLTKGERRLLACYLMYPERLMELARKYVRASKERREQMEQQQVLAWKKHLRLLPKMHEFALGIEQN
ncbi:MULTISPECIES: phosphotransferase [Aneurinibacillus]|uniref:Phosphotransferase n=1 Tax=Aneurinibacillus thermoaerophilus TaxID=143495 RepID=A0A1G7ZT86_ANETH|nr:MULTISPECIES: phosphotransferase [Aneurinibacillus]AMA72095.1 hypothetical protein ACH33_04015 [Aneurinibacillus sp. XH2]MED0676378.1 phosphotransferase [Aneurinibacillus thermoaerophilus]MED0678890.1 phosphotransferase [Aneurinibacillus thermoaerophilus]MED0736427.1 phosphotransferase [Aneurinibacillus thermoaerophilus]MED0755930.1 phosphotransferase [Aneurinibacillus thermoaerophilus]